MKRIFNRVTVILAGIILCLTVSGCKEEEYVYEESGIDVSSGAILEYEDTHGGFHGDGRTYAKIKFSDDSCLEGIKENDNWKSLPLTENVEALVYGIENGNVKVGPFIQNDGEGIFPVIENGYYYFEDRQADEGDKFNDSEVLKRPSINVSIAIYDEDSDILYFCEFDT